MKKIFYFTFFALVFSVTTHAQENDKPSYLYHTYVQFQELDFTGFNKQLTDLNLLPLSNNTAEIGTGVTMIFRRFSSDLSFVFGVKESQLQNDPTGPRTQFRHFGLRGSESINVLNPESDWFFGPEIAFNGSFQQLLVTGRNNGRTFQEAALNMVYNFERFAVTTDLGITLSKNIRYNDLLKRARVMNIKVRGGYRFDGEVENWNLNKIIAQENLGVVAGGWYGAVVFGITL